MDALIPASSRGRALCIASRYGEGEVQHLGWELIFPTGLLEVALMVIEFTRRGSSAVEHEAHKASGRSVQLLLVPPRYKGPCNSPGHVGPLPREDIRATVNKPSLVAGGPV